MSSTASQLPGFARPGRHSPQQSASTTFREVHLQSQHGLRSVSSQPHAGQRNTSVTSNPVQLSQRDVRQGSETTYSPAEQFMRLQATTSPDPSHMLPQSHYIDESTSHHDSSFDDLFSTEGSSENHLSEETTPQEFIWEQQFLAYDSTHLQIFDPYSAASYDHTSGACGPTEFEGAFESSDEPLEKISSGEELRGQLMDTAAPASQYLSALGKRGSETRLQSMDQSSAVSNAHQRANSQTLRVNTNRHRTPSPNHKVGTWQQTTTGQRAPSPVVMVSSYEAADHGYMSHVQSSSKRDRGDVSSDDDDEESSVSGDANSGERQVESVSHLMPPDVNEVDRPRHGSSQREGLDPYVRTDEITLSVKDIEEQRHLEEKNAEVQTWLVTSDAGNEVGDDYRTAQRSPKGSRPRAHTAGAQFDTLGRVYPDTHIPGPGVVIQVDSEEEYSDDESISPSQIQDHTEQMITHYHETGTPSVSPHALQALESSENTAFPALEDEVTPPEEQEPLPHQFYRRTPWQDPARGPPSDTREQPSTSNAAAHKFNQEAIKWETASRAATWGTRRRLSESEVSSIVEGSQIRHLSLSKRGRERGSSFLNKARGLLPRRSSSNIKAEQAPEKGSATRTHSHRSSVGHAKPAQRMPSLSKPKSPPLDTGNAFKVMTDQLALIGRGNTVKQEQEAATKTSRLRKSRSKSDTHRQTKSPGLTELMTRHGGPPVPTLASPMHEREPILAAQVIDNEDAQADDDDDDQTDEVAIRMDLTIRAEDILPTIEGFKDHTRKLNPRLEAYLIDRIGQEQIRRYKKLVEAKIKHTRSVQLSKNCPSGKFCFELGGDASLLAPRASSKDPDAILTQFQISSPADDEVDESGLADGVVTPALFPPGIPLPPVKRLPAEFECPLCFKVKKFQKPSDWTKHVHEDVQPFSCTFPNCPESKSFKRKADWVRHENERHRHLEWWRCSIPECSHICYRKDNFVQHLVREHKMTEPKLRGRGSGSSKAKPANSSAWQPGQEDNEVWRLVEECRHETQSKPKDEPCRFCGNICSSFKKLSVHMGKHMEQIAMPVLDLVNMRQVSPDTVISPIEQSPAIPSTFASFPPTANTVDMTNLSPYPNSAASAYQTSSAGHSPTSMHSRMHNGRGFHFEQQGYYSPHTVPSVGHAQPLNDVYGGAGAYSQRGHTFMDSGDYMSSSLGTGLQEHGLSSQDQLALPRSQPATIDYNNPTFGSAGIDFSQASLPTVYASAHSMSGYVPQYPPSVLHGSSSQSPVAVTDRTGLGLANRNQAFGYNIPSNSHVAGNMPYPQP
ncbi:hypothetical protein PV08_00771 [Exophiala spinifera]|uniref:C2H2-type domain-containing protein n=1 Tax=Exophiala spinifera TaxID=91928 RepID=A0A0D1YY37_9EURO|nr:uncharacterized protein PV08_00771 [Exophiala spinifera]KIW20196.1 hypothetical protein PV08_00771 [Exophiala spinifera]